MIRPATNAEEAARVAESVMRALPGWFGLEEPLREYVAAAARLPTLVAVESDEAVGFATVKQQTRAAAEIVAMGVMPESHRRGIGRGLVDAAAEIVEDRTCLLQVKTLGPSHPSESYARTRAFYEALGFVPLEETTAFWGEANPCLVMVKVLR